MKWLEWQWRAKMMLLWNAFEFGISVFTLQYERTKHFEEMIFKETDVPMIKLQISQPQNQPQKWNEGTILLHNPFLHLKKQNTEVGLVLCLLFLLYYILFVCVSVCESFILKCSHNGYRTRFTVSTKMMCVCDKRNVLSQALPFFLNVIQLIRIYVFVVFNMEHIYKIQIQNMWKFELEMILKVLKIDCVWFCM